MKMVLIADENVPVGVKTLVRASVLRIIIVYEWKGLWKEPAMVELSRSDLWSELWNLVGIVFICCCQSADDVPLSEE